MDWPLIHLHNIKSAGLNRPFLAPELKRTFTFLTNDFTIKAKDIAMLYKQRWQV